jgi:ribosomal protein S21
MQHNKDNAYIKVPVRGNDVEAMDKAIKQLRKKINNAGTLKVLRFKGAFESKGEKRRRKEKEARGRRIREKAKMAKQHYWR